ncbi:FliI/YscN family ATPase [Frigidibacter oleivorans]|uniref:FliI/YscN family ATPase n=1 Tax=Frigidibacter oleivorans TaxID=2487129 RepID=UPI000F8E0CB2|nr:FliI/YscN family ATPase [Frigidibacter oleivorans]
MERLAALCDGVAAVRAVHAIGRVVAVGRGTLTVAGIETVAAVGDLLHIRSARPSEGEVIGLSPQGSTALVAGSLEGIALGDRVDLAGPPLLYPCRGWLGRIVSARGLPLDGRPLPRGAAGLPLDRPPPPAALRRRLGDRLPTGLAAFDSLLPLVRGQRIGLFAGSGVGKSTLLGQLARGVAADVVVVALIGERGRELRDFVEDVLGPDRLSRSVVVAATSDESPLLRRRCALAAMTVAEWFRDEGAQVLFLADSVTRFAEAHREVALAGGEVASLRGHPPSVAQRIMALAERAGPGAAAGGDITGIFSVLVAAADMDEPVADILRGTLDGHVVLDRAIAERGRFPAIDLLRSVSRALPQAATAAENGAIGRARQLLGAYERAEMAIRAGLHLPGADPLVDAAIRVWPALDAFLGEPAAGIDAAFERLRACLAPAQGIDRPGGAEGQA